MKMMEFIKVKKTSKMKFVLYGWGDGFYSKLLMMKARWMFRKFVGY
jgi:hypothetical protein